MDQFVREREDLRRLGIGAVDEDHGSESVGQGEPAELLGVELAVRVAADNAVDHDEHAVASRLFDEEPECLAPAAPALVRCEPEHLPHLIGCLDDVRPAVSVPTNGTGVLPVQARVVAVPVLPLLALVDRVQEVWARPADLGVPDCAEVRDRERLFRWCLQEQVADRRVRRRGELLQLLERRLLLAVLPGRERRKAREEVLGGQSRALSCPGEHLRTDGDPYRHGPDRRVDRPLTREPPNQDRTIRGMVRSYEQVPLPIGGNGSFQQAGQPHDHLGSRSPDSAIASAGAGRSHRDDRFCHGAGDRSATARR